MTRHVRFFGGHLDGEEWSMQDDKQSVIAAYQYLPADVDSFQAMPFEQVAYLVDRATPRKLGLPDHIVFATPADWRPLHIANIIDEERLRSFHPEVQGIWPQMSVRRLHRDREKHMVQNFQEVADSRYQWWFCDYLEAAFPYDAKCGAYRFSLITYVKPGKTMSRIEYWTSMLAKESSN